jgi:hypothetical protein
MSKKMACPGKKRYARPKFDFFFIISRSTSLLFVLSVMFMFVFFNKLMRLFVVPVVWEGYSCLFSLLILISFFLCIFPFVFLV